MVGPPPHVNTVGPGQDAGWGWGRPGGFRTESRPDLSSRERPTGPAEWRQEWGRATWNMRVLALVIGGQQGRSQVVRFGIQGSG